MTNTRTLVPFSDMRFDARSCYISQVQFAGDEPKGV